jgi:UDP-N-acetylglucosamine pyrophosphorylase
VTFFKENDYFGYDSNSIVFFPQGGLPALFYDGKIIIESEGNLSLAPGGNGAIYSEMKSRGVLEHMKNNNVKYIYLGPVDNVLLKLADPTSLGYLLKNNFDIVSHYLKKRSADEKVGLHLKVNNKVKILEYSETDQKVK